MLPFNGEHPVKMLDVTLGNHWDFIPLIRTFIENYLSISISDQKEISLISMSASELLENAFKYSSKEGVRLQLSIHEEEKMIELTLFNYTDESAAFSLIEYINMINHNSNRFQFYIEKLKNSRYMKNGRSGLGLARISHETDHNIDVHFHKDEEDSGIIELKILFKY